MRVKNKFAAKGKKMKSKNAVRRWENWIIRERKSDDDVWVMMVLQVAFNAEIRRVCPPMSELDVTQRFFFEFLTFENPKKRGNGWGKYEVPHVP